MLKEGSRGICLPLVLIDSAFKMGKKFILKSF